MLGSCWQQEHVLAAISMQHALKQALSEQFCFLLFLKTNKVTLIVSQAIPIMVTCVDTCHPVRCKTDSVPGVIPPFPCWRPLGSVLPHGWLVALVDLRCFSLHLTPQPSNPSHMGTMYPTPIPCQGVGKSTFKIAHTDQGQRFPALERETKGLVSPPPLPLPPLLKKADLQARLCPTSRL